jgi:hypothetical protein
MVYKIKQLDPQKCPCSNLQTCSWLSLHSKRTLQMGLSLESGWAQMAHACNLNYSGSRDEEDCSSRPARNTQHKKGLVGWLKWYRSCLVNVKSRVQTPVPQKKRKEAEGQRQREPGRHWAAVLKREKGAMSQEIQASRSWDRKTWSSLGPPVLPKSVPPKKGGK